MIVMKLIDQSSNLQFISWKQRLALSSKLWSFMRVRLVVGLMKYLVYQACFGQRDAESGRNTERCSPLYSHERPAASKAVKFL